MTLKSYPLAKVYGLLEPGPVVLITTSLKGRPNIMTQSWHTIMEFEPPLVGCVISNRNYSYEVLRSTRECVLAIPTVELAEAVVKCGNVSGVKVDKYKKYGLTPVPASMVDAPLIKECYANLECRLVDTRMVAKYGFFVLEVVKACVDPAVKAPRTLHHEGRGRFRVAGKSIRIRSKMK